jgi:uracil-DNA glycosylase
MSLKRKAADTPTNDSKKPKANGSITSFFGPPKTAAASTKAAGTASEKTEPPVPAVKWDKEAWVKKLTDEQKELLKLEIDTLDETWLKELREEVCSKEFLELKKFLQREKDQGKKVFPPLEDVYSWFVSPSLPPSFALHLC